MSSTSRQIQGRAGAPDPRSPKATPGKAGSSPNFLLAWWNADECGGFDLTDVWGVDTSIAVDMLRVFALLAGCHQYPDALGYGKHFEAIVRAWRPARSQREKETL